MDQTGFNQTTVFLAARVPLKLREAGEAVLQWDPDDAGHSKLFAVCSMRKRGILFDLARFRWQPDHPQHKPL